jgi:hypothetical protein
MSEERRLERLLAKVFDRLQDVQEPSSHDDVQRDFVFHMTDWQKNLEQLAGLYRSPEKYSPREASKIVAGFLCHAIPHLKAAGQLLIDDIPDGFENPVPPKPRRARPSSVKSTRAAMQR